MATQDRPIDLERSYIPMDPNAFPETMHATGEEDTPENRIPVIVYDGFNFLPTQYGYASFFGVGTKIDIEALESRIDDIFIVQTDALRNILVALSEDGIWTKEGNATGTWSHIVTLVLPTGDVHNKWTRCVIGNEVFMYQQGGPGYYVMNSGNSFVPTIVIPTFLNMEGQIGIFKAGGRLGFWDSDGSVSWSDVDFKNDFVPSLTTGAANSKFQQVVGKITAILQHGNGFIIYSTKSVVVVVRSADANYFWASDTVFNNNGISYYNQVVMGQPDTTHYAYTTFGFVKIENGRPEYIIAEVFSYIKEKREPVYLTILEGRFLFIGIIDEDLIFPEVTFTNVEVPASFVTWAAGAAAVLDPNGEGECNALAGGNNQEGTNLFNAHGWTSRGQATADESVPIFEDHLASVFEVAKIKAWKTFNPSTFGSDLYFSSTAFDDGSITKIDSSGNEFMVPSVSPKGLEEDPNAFEHIEDNEFNFYFKQEMLWHAEERMYEDWKFAIVHKIHSDVTVPHITYVPIQPIIGETTDHPEHEFGPYVSPTFQSEANRFYGFSSTDKSAWLQRSLTKGVNVKVIENLKTTITNNDQLRWELLAATTTSFGISSLVQQHIQYETYDGLIGVIESEGSIPGLIGATHAIGAFDSFTVTGAHFANSGTTEAPGIQNAATIRSVATDVVLELDGHADVTVTATFLPWKGYFSWPVTSSTNSVYYYQGGVGYFTELGVENPQDFAFNTFAPSQVVNLTIGSGVYRDKNVVVQSFNTPTFEEVSIDTCLHKELGFTKIKSKGHYEGDTLVEDTEAGTIDDEPSALTFLLTLFGAANEAAMWAIGGVSNKVDFLHTFDFILNPDPTTYLEVALAFGATGGENTGAEEADYTDVCEGSPSPDPTKQFSFNGDNVSSGSPFLCTIPTVFIDGEDFTFEGQVLELPPGSFLLQDGSIEPLYPTFAGAFVYDLQYKKWGKMGQDYKCLLDYSPINTEAGDKTIPIDLFGVNGGALLTDGSIAIFTKTPSESIARYGKIGYFRQGFTDIETLELQFRGGATGSVTVECSIDGKNVDGSLTVSENFSNTNFHVMGVSRSAKWFNVVLRGFYDLKGLQFKGRKKGKR